MKVFEAKELVLGLISRDLRLSGAPVFVEPRSPDPVVDQTATTETGACVHVPGE